MIFNLKYLFVQHYETADITQLRNKKQRFIVMIFPFLAMKTAILFSASTFTIILISPTKS